MPQMANSTRLAKSFYHLKSGHALIIVDNYDERVGGSTEAVLK